MRREVPLRRAGTHLQAMWTPDQQHITPQERRAALHPGNAESYFAASRRNDGMAVHYRVDRLQVSPPHSAPTQPSTRSASGPATEMLLA